MSPSPDLLTAVQNALDNLHQQCEVESDYALVKKLRNSGLRTSYHTLWKWRNGKWNDNDLVLIAALTNTDICTSTPNK